MAPCACEVTWQSASVRGMNQMVEAELSTCCDDLSATHCVHTSHAEHECKRGQLWRPRSDQIVRAPRVAGVQPARREAIGRGHHGQTGGSRSQGRAGLQRALIVGAPTCRTANQFALVEI